MCAQPFFIVAAHVSLTEQFNQPVYVNESQPLVIEIIYKSCILQNCIIILYNFSLSASWKFFEILR